MDTDLIREQIDRSFGDGPEHPDLEVVLARGRSSVRRRRLAAAAGGLGAAAATVVVALALAGGPPETGTAPPAAPSPSATPTVRPSAPVSEITIRPRRWPTVYVDPAVDPFDAVELRRDGTIHVSEDVTVTLVDRHPWPEPPDTRAVVLVYEQGGETHWYAGRKTGSNGTSASTTAVPGRAFEDWVAEQRAALLQGGGA
jgi:hypothetical protein